jgi:hypothetical protein
MAIDPTAQAAAQDKAHELVEQYGQEGPTTSEERAQAVQEVLTAYDRAKATTIEGD